MDNRNYTVEYSVIGETGARVIPCDNRETAEALTLDLVNGGNVSSVTIKIDQQRLTS